MWGGIANTLGVAGLGGANPSAFVKQDNRPDWIPGDWGYVVNAGQWTNTAFAGENIIYTGNDLYWGHAGAGVEYERLNAWLRIVRGWNGSASISDVKRRPGVGLTN